MSHFNVWFPKRPRDSQRNASGGIQESLSRAETLGLGSEDQEVDVGDTLWTPRCVGIPGAFDSGSSQAQVVGEGEGEGEGEGDIDGEGEGQGGGEGEGEGEEGGENVGKEVASIGGQMEGEENTRSIDMAGLPKVKAHRVKRPKHTLLGSIAKVLGEGMKVMAQMMKDCEKERREQEGRLLKERLEQNERLLKLRLDEETKRMEMYMRYQLDLAKIIAISKHDQPPVRPILDPQDAPHMAENVDDPVVFEPNDVGQQIEVLEGHLQPHNNAENGAENDGQQPIVDDDVIPPDVDPFPDNVDHWHGYGASIVEELEIGKIGFNKSSPMAALLEEAAPYGCNFQMERSPKICIFSNSPIRSAFFRRAASQDDLIIWSDALNDVEHVKALLRKQFDMNDLGELRYFLGFEMIRNEGGIWLSQKKYGLDMKYGMADCKPIFTPLDQNLKLRIDEGEVLDDATMYRKIVDTLIYMTISRLDLSYAVGLVIQFMQLPRKPHLDAVRRILTYVRATLNYALFYDAGT
ncbi:hypothetical protein L7F22_025005 [Adiantum nelumboides]|nr:hypothetical protein [Adiantum nelumboides]